MIPVQEILKGLLKGTVFKRVWLKVVVIGIYTTVVVGLYMSIPTVNGKQLEFDLTDILGIVTGLLLVFRTQIAYDRYWEGRNLWTSLGSTVGTLARLVWISVKERDPQDVVEKKTMMNLLSAFPLATKHYLRNEYSQDFEDMKEYITGFPEILLKPPPQRVKAGIAQAQKQDEIPDFVAPSNAPCLITYYLGMYFDKVSDRGLVETNVMKQFQDSVSALGDYLSSFEKILRTPMPLAYSRHLGHCLYIYILALPFQLVHSLMWLTIPVVVVATFAILGILEIGGEIENPFGYDDNDLALDDFCTDIIKEIRLILSLRLPKDWALAPTNYPCPTALPKVNAEDLATTQSIEDLREMFRMSALLNPPPRLGKVKKDVQHPMIGQDNPIMADKVDMPGNGHDEP